MEDVKVVEEERATLEEALAEVVGHTASQIVSNEEVDPKTLEGLSKVVDSLVSMQEAERNTQLEYDKMAHEAAIERSKSWTERIKTGVSALGILAGIAMGIYTVESQLDLAEADREFDLALFEDTTEFEKENVVTTQAARTVLAKLGRRHLPNLLGKIGSFNFFNK